MDITVYHGSHIKIDKIDFDSCHLGWHAGNICQAIDMAEPIREADKYKWDEVYVYVSVIDTNENNTVTIPDIFLYDYDFIDIIKKTLKACIKNQFPHNHAFYELDSCTNNSEIRETLLINGIKYIRYKNKYETNGISYCILDENTEIKEYNLYDFLTNHINYTIK